MPAGWPTDANMCQPLVVRQSGRVPGPIVRLYSCNGARFSRIPPHASVAHSTTGQRREIHPTIVSTTLLIAARAGECRIVRCKRRLKQTTIGKCEPEDAHETHAAGKTCFRYPQMCTVLRQEAQLDVGRREGGRGGRLGPEGSDVGL